MARRKVKKVDDIKPNEKYIAILPNQGDDDEDTAIIGSSIEDVTEKILEYFDNLDMDNEEIDDYIADQSGIKVYKVMPGATRVIYAETEISLKLSDTHCDDD